MSGEQTDRGFVVTDTSTGFGAEERVLGLQVPPLNLEPACEEQARDFIDHIVERAFADRVATPGRES
jgi:hypothetical protein